MILDDIVAKRKEQLARELAMAWVFVSTEKAEKEGNFWRNISQTLMSGYGKHNCLWCQTA